jgi:hypothetical protein
LCEVVNNPQHCVPPAISLLHFAEARIPLSIARWQLLITSLVFQRFKIEVFITMLHVSKALVMMIEPRQSAADTCTKCIPQQ